MITESRLFNIGSLSGTPLNETKLSNMDFFIPNFIKNDDVTETNQYFETAQSSCRESFRWWRPWSWAQRAPLSQGSRQLDTGRL